MNRLAQTKRPSTRGARFDSVASFITEPRHAGRIQLIVATQSLLAYWATPEEVASRRRG
jgi:hypothetical protein